MKIEVHENRHPGTDGKPWGWVSGIPGSVALTWRGEEGRESAQELARRLVSGTTPSHGTTPGNAVALLRELQNVTRRASTDPIYGADVDGAVRRAYHAMTGEYPEPEQVRAILAPEN